MVQSALFDSYHLKVSKEARNLAKKYFEFVTKVLGRRVKWDRLSSMIDNWAKDFDAYYAETKTPYNRMNEVLDWYMANCKKSKYIYPCPIAFLDHFRTLEQRWEWSYRPVPVEELTPILDKLRVESWPGEDGDLVTAVSKSVFNVREVLKRTSALPDLAVKGVERCIMSVNAFVTEHFTEWRKKHLNRPNTPIWTAELQKEQVLTSIVAEWKKMGFGTNACDKFSALVLSATESEGKGGH